MDQPQVSIIIVNYNNCLLLKRCLSSLNKVRFKSFETILVDNGSRDKSLKMVKEEFPRVKLIVLEKNFGFAAPNNCGAGISQGKYLLFLNNDTEVDANFLAPLVAVLDKNPQVGAVGSKLYWGKTKRVDSLGSYLTQYGFLWHFGLRDIDKGQFSSQTFPVFSIKGASLMVRRNLFQKLKGFEEGFFAYFEESDLCWKIWLLGKEVVTEPRSVVYHFLGETAKYFPKHFIIYISYRNRLISLWQNLGSENWLKIISIHYLGCLGVLLWYLLKGKFFQAGAISAALFWPIFHQNFLFRKRSFVNRKIRRLKDSQFFPKTFRKVPLKILLSYLY